MIAGGNAEFGGLPRSNTLKVLGLDMFIIGQVTPENPGFQAIDQEGDGGYFRFVFHEDRLVGTVLLGDMQLMSATKRAVEGKQDCRSLLRRSPSAEAVSEHFVGRTSSGNPSRRAAPFRGSAWRSETGPAPEKDTMTSYECRVCGYVYDETKQGRKWSDLPDDWGCPGCGAPKSSFEPAGAHPQEPSGTAFRRVSVAHRVLGYLFLAIYVVLISCDSSGGLTPNSCRRWARRSWSPARC